MADLIPCPSCKKKISVEAQACPKCGQPITDEARAAGRKKMAEDKRNGRIGCVVFLVLAVALGSWLANGDKSEETKSAASSPPATTQDSPATPVAPPTQEQPSVAAKPQAPEAVFDLTPKQFVANYNNALKGIDTKQRAKITKTSGDSVQLEMSKYCGALLSTAQGGKISSVMFIGAGDGSALSGADIMLGIAFTIAGVRPEWPAARRGKIINRFMGKNGEIPNQASTTMDGVKFDFSFTQGVGIFFTASPAR